jgi:hypothetical protein
MRHPLGITDAKPEKRSKVLQGTGLSQPARPDARNCPVARNGPLWLALDSGVGATAISPHAPPVPDILLSFQKPCGLGASEVMVPHAKQHDSTSRHDRQEARSQTRLAAVGVCRGAAGGYDARGLSRCPLPRQT